jgi:hypothetical protein
MALDFLDDAKREALTTELSSIGKESMLDPWMNADRTEALNNALTESGVDPQKVFGESYVSNWASKNKAYQLSGLLADDTTTTDTTTTQEAAPNVGADLATGIVQDKAGEIAKDAVDYGKGLLETDVPDITGADTLVGEDIYNPIDVTTVDMGIDYSNISFTDEQITEMSNILDISPDAVKAGDAAYNEAFEAAMLRGDANAVEQANYASDQAIANIDPSFLEKYSGAAVGAIGAAFSTYMLATNWDEMSTDERISSGVDSAEHVYAVAKSLEAVTSASLGTTSTIPQTVYQAAAAEYSSQLAGGATQEVAKAASQEVLSNGVAESSGWLNTVGSVLGWAAVGYGAYNLVENWDEMDTGSKVASASGLAAAAIAKFAGSSYAWPVALFSLGVSAMNAASAGRNPDGKDRQYAYAQDAIPLADGKILMEIGYYESHKNPILNGVQDDSTTWGSNKIRNKTLTDGWVDGTGTLGWNPITREWGFNTVYDPKNNTFYNIDQDVLNNFIYDNPLNSKVYKREAEDYASSKTSEDILAYMNSTDEWMYEKPFAKDNSFVSDITQPEYPVPIGGYQDAVEAIIGNAAWGADWKAAYMDGGTSSFDASGYTANLSYATTQMKEMLDANNAASARWDALQDDNPSPQPDNWVSTYQLPWDEQPLTEGYNAYREEDGTLTRRQDPSTFGEGG